MARPRLWAAACASTPRVPATLKRVADIPPTSAGITREPKRGRYSPAECRRRDVTQMTDDQSPAACEESGLNRQREIAMRHLDIIPDWAILVLAVLVVVRRLQPLRRLRRVGAGHRRHCRLDRPDRSECHRSLARQPTQRAMIGFDTAVVAMRPRDIVHAPNWIALAPVPRLDLLRLRHLRLDRRGLIGMTARSHRLVADRSSIAGGDV